MGQLTELDHDQMDVFLARILDEYKTGKLDRTGAVAGIGHVIDTLDKGNIGEVRSWFAEFSR